MQSPTLAVAALLLLASPLVGQGEPGPIRVFGGADFIVASPTEEFAENVARGFGLDIHARVTLDEPGMTSLRFDMGFPPERAGRGGGPW